MSGSLLRCEFSTNNTRKLLCYFSSFSVICPIEGLGMIVWWIVDEVRLNLDPYKEFPFWVFTTTSLITILTEVQCMERS